MMAKITGLFIFFFSILVTILPKSKLSYFFNVESLFLVIVPLLILFFFKLKSKKTEMNGISAGSELSHWELIGSTSLQLGILGAFLGFVGLFKNINIPSAIGPFMAVFLLSMIYSLIGFLISFFMGNFKARPTYYYISFLQLFFLISTFYILGLSFKK